MPYENLYSYISLFICLLHLSSQNIIYFIFTKNSYKNLYYIIVSSTGNSSPNLIAPLDGEIKYDS